MIHTNLRVRGRNKKLTLSVMLLATALALTISGSAEADRIYIPGHGEKHGDLVDMTNQNISIRSRCDGEIIVIHWQIGMEVTLNPVDCGFTTIRQYARDPDNLVEFVSPENSSHLLVRLEMMGGAAFIANGLTFRVGSAPRYVGVTLMSGEMTCIDFTGVKKISLLHPGAKTYVFSKNLKKAKSFLQSRYGLPRCDFRRHAKNQ